MSLNSQLIFDSKIGKIKIVGSDSGIEEISLENAKGDSSKEIPFCLVEGRNQLEEYFKGERKEFDLKLNPKGTDFQNRVWAELLKIPFGQTTSYLKLSEKLGDVKAIRAVGGANGKNKIAIVIPCHRVIGSDGKLVGYAGGLWRKQWLLDHEKASFQMKMFF
ncbi:MAG: methylated-DNA--[protein]-cysteine S-methyltransferase [Calditrichaeota bacterium]|nr:MAG: methylated-DNA--[protein]-cysteine S-methyltransferase [Calditrichota bacterium]